MRHKRPKAVLCTFCCTVPLVIVLLLGSCATALSGRTAAYEKAAVELAKYMVRRERVPPPYLARPWEFLNYESFTPGSPTRTGLFEFSMGLIRRGTDYRLGAYVASPRLTRESRKSAVLTLIVDVSGSMNDLAASPVELEGGLNRLNLVKHGLDRLVETSLKEGDVVSIVTFSDNAKTLLRGARYPKDRSKILRTLDTLKTEGSTNLNRGIKEGYDTAVALFDRTKLNRVLILSDAFANCGEVDLKIISQKTRIGDSEGIYFSGLGIGAGFNEAFLNELTETGKGAYFSLVTKNDAARAFEERFIALLAVAAKNVRFRLDFPEFLARDIAAYYQDPVTYEKKEERVCLTVSELLKNHGEKVNIYQAEIIFLDRSLSGRVPRELHLSCNRGVHEPDSDPGSTKTPGAEIGKKAFDVEEVYHV